MDTLNQMIAALLADDFAPLLKTLVFLSTSFLAFGGMLWLVSGNPVERRLREVKEGIRERHEEPYREGFFDVRWIEPVAKVFLPRDDWRLSRLRSRMVMAGYRSNSAIYYFVAIKAFCALLMVALVFPLLLLGTIPLSNRMVAVTTLVAAGLVGFYLPDLFVYQRRQERQRAFVEGFPDAMDMLVVCVEAGLGLDAAIDRVGREMTHSHPELGTEITLVSLGMRAGKSRKAASEASGARTGVPQVQSLAALLVQAEHFGTSIATTLQEHAEEMRMMRLQQAKEKAAKLPVKLVFPIVFFIFPALFLVILGPAVIRIWLGLATGFGAN